MVSLADGHGRDQLLLNFVALLLQPSHERLIVLFGAAELKELVLSLIPLRYQLLHLRVLLTQERVLRRDPVAQLVHDDALLPVVLDCTLTHLQLLFAALHLLLKLSFELFRCLETSGHVIELR